MGESIEIKVIGHIKSDFSKKFGIPRQSGLVKGIESKIILLPQYRNKQAFRGLEEYSHIWLIWQFCSLNSDKQYTPTVRPPRLGGNKRMGVFATRSPYRPNPIGLSAVKLEKIEYTDELGPVLHISGADLLDNTPIIDIKPYLNFADSYPDATSGFADENKDYRLSVECGEDIKNEIDPKCFNDMVELLALDPRPSYHDDPNRIYGMSYADMEIKFLVENGVLKIKSIDKNV